MANKTLFASLKGALRTDTVNYAGGVAYKLSDRQALAQLAATGCLSQTYTPMRARSLMSCWPPLQRSSPTSWPRRQSMLASMDT